MKPILERRLRNKFRGEFFLLGLLVGISIAAVGYAFFPAGWNWFVPRPHHPATADEILNSAREFQKYDLVAQEAMARATNWIVWLTLATVLTGIVGTTVLLINFYASRDATEAAHKGNEEARMANQIAREQNRPWLSFEENNSSISLSLHDGQLRFSSLVDIDCTNLGKSPAKNIGIHVRAVLDDIPEDLDTTEQIRSRHVRFGRYRYGPIFPDQKLQIWNRNIQGLVEGDTLSYRKDEKIRLWVLTTVLYQSPGGDIHQTTIPFLGEFYLSDFDLIFSEIGELAIKKVGFGHHLT